MESEHIDELGVRLGVALSDNESLSINLRVANCTIDRLSSELRRTQAEVQRLRPKPNCPLCKDIETWPIRCPCSVRREEENK